MRYLNLPTELKAAGDTGSFEGYAAIFGNIDLGGDVIERGAFKEFVKNRDGKTVVLWQHSMRDPIGVADVSQDDKGLRFAGQLVMEDATARKAHAHMKAGSVGDMSIGFNVLDGGSEVMNSGVRKLSALKLFEISPVTFGMNPLAGIEAVKHAAHIASIREFEDFLRDVGGYSKAQAKLLASGGYKALQSHRDDGDTETAMQQVLNSIETFQFPKISL